jgi:hypothetical protein
VSGQNQISRWEVVGDLLISVTRSGVITDPDWESFMKELRTQPVTNYFAGTLGKAETTSTQRKQAADVLKAKGIRTAAVTDDTFTRGIVTAVSWLGANVAAFAWSDIDGALKYLNVTEPVASQARAIVMKLRVASEVGKRK